MLWEKVGNCKQFSEAGEDEKNNLMKKLIDRYINFPGSFAHSPIQLSTYRPSIMY